MRRWTRSIVASAGAALAFGVTLAAGRVADVRIMGLVFAGTATDRHAAMARFVESTLALRRVEAAGAGVDMFELPDGARFAVAGQRDQARRTSRTIGFLVADLAPAVAELRAAGVEVSEAAENDWYRYAHFTAPDGELYELVQER